MKKTFGEVTNSHNSNQYSIFWNIDIMLITLDVVLLLKIIFSSFYFYITDLF